MRTKIEKPSFADDVDGEDELSEWVEQNWVSVLAYHARPAMVFTERETSWGEILQDELLAWGKENAIERTSAGKIWDGFCGERENGSIRLVVPCVCRGRGTTCTTCGPIRGKIIGDVYLLPQQK